MKKARDAAVELDGPMVHASSAIKDKDLLRERRVYLVDVATRVLIQRGFSSVSVNEIAEEAGISIGSLYKYVRSKHDLLWLVLDSLFRETEKAFDDAYEELPPGERFVATFESFLRHVHLVRRGMLLIYREFANLSEESQRELYERDRGIYERLESLIERGNELGEWDADPRFGAMNLYAVADTWILKGWAMRDVTLDEYVAVQTRLMLSMLGALATPADPHPR